MANNKLLVAAVDFGTTYSGYAFSFHHEFEREPTKVSANQWSAGARALVSLKTPTCVLIKPDKTFDSFGYEAENKYSELAEDEEHINYFFFKRFKMMLFDKIGLKRDIVLEDDKGKTLPAKTVFTMSIKYLKDHLLKNSRDRLSGLEDGDIQWVLTVPAIWNDAAKQFMREAAVDAGIVSDNLLISLEPEAASLFCRHLPVSKSVGPDKICLSSLGCGSQYMVLDCGGGTVDITVHQVMTGGCLKELHKASGGAWGGTRVDEAFKQMFIKIMGAPVVNKFYKKHTADYLDMFREFEVKKREISPDLSGKVTFRVPIALKETFEEETDEDLKEVIEQTHFAGKITWTGDKMRVDASIIKALFQDAADSIVEHMKKLLKDCAVKDTSVVLMVGGFSESPMLQQAVRKNFPQLKIIIPEEAGLAVLKGAVVFGHSPSTIAERVCKYTYGVMTNMPFEEGKHPESKKKVVGSHVKCQDVFHKHVQVGQTVKVGEAHDEQVYTPIREDQTKIDFEVYASSQKNPDYVTDSGCTKLGLMTVDIPDTSKGLDREVYVKMIFGGTEVAVEGREKDTGRITKASFDFLG